MLMSLTNITLWPVSKTKFYQYRSLSSTKIKSLCAVCYILSLKLVVTSLVSLQSVHCVVWWPHLQWVSESCVFRKYQIYTIDHVLSWDFLTPILPAAQSTFSWKTVHWILCLYLKTYLSRVVYIQQTILK